MRLYKKMTDDILRLSRATPEQLLGWFLDTYEIELPCMQKPFLSKYWIMDTHRDKETKSYKESASSLRIAPVGRSNYDVLDYLIYAKASEENLNDLVEQFKKYYKLK